MSEIATATPEPAVVKKLTLNDRCDSCSAAAKVTAVLKSGLELIFCRHHFKAQEAALVGAGATIYEEEDED